jgi:hypothetical protein
MNRELKIRPTYKSVGVCVMDFIVMEDFKLKLGLSYTGLIVCSSTFFLPLKSLLPFVLWSCIQKRYTATNRSSRKRRAFY